MVRLALPLVALGSVAAVPAQGTTAVWIPRQALVPAEIAQGAIGHSLSHCLASNRVTLFGGVRGSTYLRGTFEWDGGAWIDRAPASSPTARSYHAATSLFPKPGVLLQGGRTAGGVVADTWEWNGSAWILKSTAGPGNRELHALAYDYVRDRVVLFGGTTTIMVPGLADTWEWDGSVWTQKLTSTSPSARVGHVMAFDQPSGRVVLFGGTNPPGATTLGDTWEWDGTSWRPRTPTVSPPPRAYATMTLDLSRGGLVLHGGRSVPNGTPYGDSWTWDSAGNSWKPLVPVFTLGPKRDLVGTAYDLARGRVVLFGGYATPTYHADTWELAASVPAASATGYGAGCPGTAGVPVLAGVGLPKLGSTVFALSLANARANAPAALLLGELPASVPVGGGCTLLVRDPAVTLPLTTSNSGSAALPLTVPSGLALLGLQLSLQGAVVDPLGALGSAACATAGLGLVLGS